MSHSGAAAIAAGVQQPLLLAADVLHMGSVHNTVGLRTCRCCTALTLAVPDQIPSIPAYIRAVALAYTLSMCTAQHAAYTAKPDNLLTITDSNPGGRDCCLAAGVLQERQCV
jgi:hypothetical protein